MKLVFKTSLLAAALVAVAGCETTAPSQHPEPVDPQPPAVNQQGAVQAPAPTAPAAQAAPAQQGQQTTVITLHLAQQQPENGLMEIDAGGQTLYALPQPVITQAHMGRVSPVTSQDQRSFLMLEMNEHGIPRLQTVTEQAKGHYLLLSVQGQLVSVVQIGETIADGRLLVATQGPDHTQGILDLMRGS